MRVTVELTPAEFLDRFAVLTVKRAKIGVAFDADWWRYAQIADPLLANADVRAIFDELILVHTRAFEVLERAVPSALNGGMGMEEHTDAIRLNRDRVMVMRRFDAIFGSASEPKSYYKEG